jgi:hypothetical protein
MWDTFSLAQTGSVHMAFLNYWAGCGMAGISGRQSLVVAGAG